MTVSDLDGVQHLVMSGVVQIKFGRPDESLVVKRIVDIDKARSGLSECLTRLSIGLGRWDSDGGGLENGAGIGNDFLCFMMILKQKSRRTGHEGSCCGGRQRFGRPSGCPESTYPLRSQIR